MPSRPTPPEMISSRGMLQKASSGKGGVPLPSPSNGEVPSRPQADGMLAIAKMATHLNRFTVSKR